MTRIIDWPRYSRWTWIVAVLLLVLLLLMWWFGHGPGAAGSCCQTSGADSGQALPPTAVSAPSPALAASVADPPGFESSFEEGAGADLGPEGATALVAASLALTHEGDAVVLDGAVPDQATRARVLADARAELGADKLIDRLAVDAAIGASPCGAKLAGLLALFRDAPSIQAVTCSGTDAVVLTGTAANEASKAAYGQGVQQLLGAEVRVDNRLEVLAPAAPVSRAEDVQCGARIAAAVTFATGSARIDAEAHRLLDAIAPCLASGDYAVVGHTDSTGSAEINQRLSKARAEAVRAYLIGKGVASERLTAIGRGAAEPIADNATAEGRAQNRRIEFVRQ